MAMKRIMHEHIGQCRILNTFSRGVYSGLALRAAGEHCYMEGDQLKPIKSALRKHARSKLM